MLVKKIYKLCKTCLGRKEVEVTLTFEAGEQKQTLPCPHCKGNGTHLWGYVDDASMDVEELKREFMMDWSKNG